MGTLRHLGSVAKITGKEGLIFKGNARVFDSEEQMLDGLKDGLIKPKDVVVIRYEGPKEARVCQRCLHQHQQ